MSSPPRPRLVTYSENTELDEEDVTPTPSEQVMTDKEKMNDEDINDNGKNGSDEKDRQI